MGPRCLKSIFLAGSREVFFFRGFSNFADQVENFLEYSHRMHFRTLARWNITKSMCTRTFANNYLIFGPGTYKTYSICGENKTN
jgi:hypothetical protein